MKLMPSKVECQLHENVLPWLYKKVDIFVSQDNQSLQSAFEIIENGLKMNERGYHATLIKHENDRLRAEANAKEEIIQATHRKLDRRLQREALVKDQIKETLKIEVLSMIVEKGDTRNPSQNYELLDIESNYDSNKLSQTALGGYFQQMYFVVCSIFDQYGDDLSEYYKRKTTTGPQSKEANKAFTVRELLIE